MCDIHGRIFNHRPFVQGEVRSFVKEFEETRGDREVERTFRVLERVTELRDCEIDKLKAQCETSVPAVRENVRAAQALCDRILDKDRSAEIEQALESSQHAREREWKAFSEEAKAKRERIDEAFRQKEADLRRQYADFESQFSAKQ